MRRVLRNHGCSAGDPRSEWEREVFSRAVFDTIDRQIAERKLDRDFVRRAVPLWVRALAGRGARHASDEFKMETGADPPRVLAIAPTGACNLTCEGCYAGSEPGLASLSFGELERLIADAVRSWGIRVVVFTGGEPFLYRSESKGILDVIERNPGLLFLVFTNGTLIDRAVAGRLASLGNVTVALSVEGLRESTDARRGPGTFDKVVGALVALEEAGAWHGISMTATRHNCEELYSDELLDFFFDKHSPFYAFVFQYMPEGRDPDPSLMPTPEQRIWMWERSWEVIEKRRTVLFDFWNHVSLVGGCLAAGRERGYLFVDWDGNVLPCVFAPYSACNVRDIYSRGGSLADVWAAPLLSEIRGWQRRRSASSGAAVCAGSGGTLMCACPVRDHFGDFMDIVARTQASPVGSSTGACLSMADLTSPMIEYGEDLASLSREASGG